MPVTCSAKEKPKSVKRGKVAWRNILQTNQVDVKGDSPKSALKDLEDSRMSGAKCSTAEDGMFALLLREKYTEDRQIP